MRCVMSRAKSSLLTITVLLIALPFLLSLASCQNDSLLPTPTAIPLEATVTSFPRPSLPPVTPANRPHPTPNSTSAPLAPTPTGSELLISLDDRLAEATITGFLDRLATGHATKAFDLFLTEEAKASGSGQLLSLFVGKGTGLEGVALVQFLRTSDATYEAQAELQWTGSEDSHSASQTMTLALAYQRGLWLIDDIRLGNLLVLTATPTPRRASDGWRQPPGLGGKLVFQTSSGGDIYTINADGSGLRRLTDGLDPAWSPDGTHIAFTRWRPPWGLYVVGQDGTGEQRFADLERLKEVTWSPDGSRIAFTVKTGSTDSVQFCFYGFCFSTPPLFTSEMWMVTLDTGILLNLPLDDQAIHSPDWSPTRDCIVYTGDRGLAWIDLEDMETGQFAGSNVWDGSPAFSPDGQQIAFMSQQHDHWEIFRMNANGSGRRQLTHRDPDAKQPSNNVAPTWSPDGSQIAFLSNRDGPWRIYVMEADGSNQRPMFGDKLDHLGLRYEWASERIVSWSDSPGK
jgi:dipeptidyl aminopeptidase/acylaminoacyl peptidase